MGAKNKEIKRRIKEKEIKNATLKFEVLNFKFSYFLFFITYSLFPISWFLFYMRLPKSCPEVAPKLGAN